MISKDEVLHVAQLARLELTDAEIAYFTPQLGSIINYIDLLNTAEIGGVEPTCGVDPDYDPLRDDVEAQSLDQNVILANGPLVKKGHFAVPKVIEQSAGTP